MPPSTRTPRKIQVNTSDGSINLSTQNSFVITYSNGTAKEITYSNMETGLQIVYSDGTTNNILWEVIPLVVEYYTWGLGYFASVSGNSCIIYPPSNLDRKFSVIFYTRQGNLWPRLVSVEITDLQLGSGMACEVELFTSNDGIAVSWSTDAAQGLQDTTVTFLATVTNGSSVSMTVFFRRR